MTVSFEQSKYYLAEEDMPVETPEYYGIKGLKSYDGATSALISEFQRTQAPVAVRTVMQMAQHDLYSLSADRKDQIIYVTNFIAEAVKAPPDKRLNITELQIVAPIHLSGYAPQIDARTLLYHAETLAHVSLPEYIAHHRPEMASVAIGVDTKGADGIDMCLVEKLSREVPELAPAFARSMKQQENGYGTVTYPAELPYIDAIVRSRALQPRSPGTVLFIPPHDLPQLNLLRLLGEEKRDVATLTQEADQAVNAYPLLGITGFQNNGYQRM